MTKAFDDIMAGLHDALAHAKGEEVPGIKIHMIEVVDVKAIRKKTGLSQTMFAKTFKLPLATLKNWEQGRRQPDGPSRALMQIIDTMPEQAVKALQRV